MINRRPDLIFLLMLLILFLFGCENSKAGKSSGLHIGYFNNITHAQALYMKARNSLQERLGSELTLEWTSFNAGPAEIEALFSGDIDIGYIGPVPAIMANGRSSGDVAVISGSAEAGAVLVTAAGSGISSAKDLDGKTIAVPQIGNTQHLCLLMLLKEYGLKTVEEGGTVTVSAVENADVANMMDQGNIDAALVPEPWGSYLEMKGARILLDYDEVYANGNYPVTVIVVRKDYLKNHPQIVETFLEEHENTTRLINEDTKRISGIVNEEILSATGKGLDEDLLARSFEKIAFSTEIRREAMSEFAEIAKEQDFITEVPQNLYTDLSEQE